MVTFCSFKRIDLFRAFFGSACEVEERSVEQLRKIDGGINCKKIVNYMVETIETDTYDTAWAEIL